MQEHKRILGLLRKKGMFFHSRWLKSVCVRWLKILTNAFSLSCAATDSQSIIADADSPQTLPYHVAMNNMPRFLLGQSPVTYFLKANRDLALKVIVQ